VIEVEVEVEKQEGGEIGRLYRLQQCVLRLPL
jgi:hypothetical protein